MGAVKTFTDAARAFSASADAAAASGAIDPSVLLQLNALPSLAATAIASLQAVSDDPETSDAVTAVELLLSQCADLGDSLLAQQPPMQTFVVPEDAPLMVVLERFYGGDAFSRAGEVEGNNPQVLGLVLVTAGTRLRLAPATV